MLKRVKDFMSTPVFQVEANTSLQEVCKLMLERGVGSVVVTEQGIPKGIFTDRDAVKAIATSLSSSDEVRLAATMGNLIIVDEDIDVFEALKIMAANKIRHLPVKNKDGNIIGMFSITDVYKVYG
ncbi:CBS domain-containing protein [Saccharolobus solfataricus]|nr:CBS domain-containing protein [Saccharolobus solfataricus]AKA74280.1 CBS domain-containing protein [Saccharolobus solfataricus]AKA76977.1 CBS domain-containing protein [Saccharolobus solfataricus]AKA79669.1 CBS domain-containing protein [Saccharolobus solfataricus]AZF68762.1 CBS domain-containing protein [Saccharolobus solfataricus]AZF71382.1 CBS domain-containing protein [Saccharolobus solfataricus]